MKKGGILLSVHCDDAEWSKQARELMKARARKTSRPLAKLRRTTESVTSRCHVHEPSVHLSTDASRKRICRQYWKNWSRNCRLHGLRQAGLPKWSDRQPSVPGRRATPLLHWDLPYPEQRIRVCAVNFLNTSPLVWGMLHGAERGVFDLSFRVPSACAEEVSAGNADIGIIPSIELNRHEYGRVHGLGIACRGAVRSILLISKTPFPKIATLAADTSSRTSVMLAQIILARRYGAEPRVIGHRPQLQQMLAAADAALIIGDPALHIDPATAGPHVLDLGAEWHDMTRLPMVFAIWAGTRSVITPEVQSIFHASYGFGRDHIEDIIRAEADPRGIPRELARQYLRNHIVSELGPAEYQGLELFLEYARSATIISGQDAGAAAGIRDA